MNALHARIQLNYADSKEAIEDVVRGLIDESQREYIVDRRSERRHSLAVRLGVTPIENGKLATEFAAVTHDISTRGISFLHDSLVECKHLLLRFPDYNRQALVVEVLRQTEIGPFKMVAGRFSTRV